MGNDYSTKISIDEECNLDTGKLPFRLVIDLLEYHRLEVRNLQKKDELKMTDFFGFFKNDRSRKVFLIFRSVGYIPGRNELETLSVIPKSIHHFTSHFTTIIPTLFIQNFTNLRSLDGIKMEPSNSNYLTHFSLISNDERPNNIERLKLTLKIPCSTDIVTQLNDRFGQNLKTLEIRSIQHRNSHTPQCTSEIDFEIPHLVRLKLDGVLNLNLLQKNIRFPNLKRLVLRRILDPSIIHQKQIEFIVKHPTIRSVSLVESTVHFDVFQLFNKQRLQKLSLMNLKIITPSKKKVMVVKSKSRITTEKHLGLFQCSNLRVLRLSQFGHISTEFLDRVLTLSGETLEFLECESCGLTDKHLTDCLLGFFRRCASNNVSIFQPELQIFFEGNSFSEECVEQLLRGKPDRIQFHHNF